MAGRRHARHLIVAGAIIIVFVGLVLNRDKSAQPEPFLPVSKVQEARLGAPEVLFGVLASITMTQRIKYVFTVFIAVDIPFVVPAKSLSGVRALNLYLASFIPAGW
jgi:hypothetical protein